MLTGMPVRRCTKASKEEKYDSYKAMSRAVGARKPQEAQKAKAPVALLERNMYGHPLGGLLWERQFEKVLLKYRWEKVPNWEWLFGNREKRLFLSVYVDDIKLAGKKIC